MEREGTKGRSSRVRQAGRTAGIVVFATLVSAFTIVCSVQICLQVWAPKIVPTPVDCVAGTLLLVDSIEAARTAAAEMVGEQAALSAFRNTVAPAWAFRPALGLECKRDPKAVARLHAVDRLRYAEEHAVRYEAADLAARRHEVERLISPLRPAIHDTL